MKQLFVILALLLSMSFYALAQANTNSTDTNTGVEITQTPIEEQSEDLAKKDGAWFVFGIGLRSVDMHLGYHVPNTDFDVRILANGLFDSSFSIQTEALSFFPNSNGLGLYSGFGAALHSQYGVGVASTTGFDIPIDGNSGILIESGINIFFNYAVEDDGITSYLPAIADRFSVGYRYSF